jgi:hypothetical protein
MKIETLSKLVRLESEMHTLVYQNNNGLSHDDKSRILDLLMELLDEVEDISKGR